MKNLSFSAACKDYFGMKPGQTLTEFLGELKALTTKDRVELSAMLASVGYTIQLATPQSAAA